ncbi:MAG: hypothetical protein PHI13_01160 [Methylococcales bacterium]|nr:hypothetical protein [Methylococcales bacterium]
MNKQWLTVIARAVTSEQELFPLNQTWQAIHQEYNIGLTQAKKLRLNSEDKQELRDLVKKITHIDLQLVSPGEFTGMEREQALSLAIDEKLAGQAVKKNRLAIKPLPDRTLKLNGQSYRLPGNGHCDMALESIACVEHQSIWIIENYRCFDRLGAIKLHESAALTEPLVVFRGDHVYQAGTVLTLIEKQPLPVWVMGDLDPKGLSIAQSYPNFAGLIAPELALLETYFNDTRKANHKLYENQLAGCRKALSDTRYPIIEACWQLMKQHQAGIVQEHWLAGDTTLNLHPVQTSEVT